MTIQIFLQDHCIKLETQLAEFKFNQEKVGDLNTQLSEEMEQSKKLRSECAVSDITIHRNLPSFVVFFMTLSVSTLLCSANTVMLLLVRYRNWK